MTDAEKKAAAAAKRAATYARRRAQEEAAAAERNAQYNDKLRARELCRQIRDSAESTTEERLRAMELLRTLTA